jgi:hypothetical protein
MNVKNQRLLIGPICKYYNECKKSTTIMGPICGYCIFENDIIKFRIENDVGITCLECAYCFNFRWCESYYIKCRYCTMFISIFVNFRQINVTYSYGPI